MRVLKVIAGKLYQLLLYPFHLESHYSLSQKQQCSYKICDDEVKRYIIITVAKNKEIKQSDLVKIVSNSLDVSNPTILSRIKELIKHNILYNNYSNGMKSPTIKLNNDKVIITYNILYYAKIYVSIIISLIISDILSYMLKSYYLILGSSITSIIILVMCLIDVLTNDSTKIVLLKI